MIFQEDSKNILSLAAPLLLLHLTVYFVHDYVNLFSLVPANTLITRTYVWNLVSSSFFETNTIKLFLDLFFLGTISSQIKIFSYEQFFLYFIFSILACSAGTSLLSFLQFAIFGNEIVLVTPYYGFSGILMTLFMYCRQTMPNQSWQAKIPILTYQYFPLVYLTFIGICSWLNILAHDFYFSFIAFFFSWSYLRFYYRYDDGNINPNSEEFAFISMFPEKAHIVIIPFSTAFYNLFALCGIFPTLEVAEKRIHHHLRPLPATSPKNNNAEPVENKPIIAPADEIAERRRAKAIKMLDAKMAELYKKSEGWDDDEVEGKLTSENNKFRV